MANSNYDEAQRFPGKGHGDGGRGGYRGRGGYQARGRGDGAYGAQGQPAQQVANT